MYDIKTETQNTICRGCLSSNRKLSPLVNYNLYWSFLREDQKIEALNISCICLCWECTATLRRTQAFQAQVQRAHDVLQDAAEALTEPTLSRLSVYQKWDYDTIIKENTQLYPKEEGENIKITINIKEEDVKTKCELDDNVRNDQDDINYSDGNDDDNFDIASELDSCDQANTAPSHVVFVSTETTARRSSRQAAEKASQVIETILKQDIPKQHKIRKETKAKPKVGLVCVPIKPLATEYRTKAKRFSERVIKSQVKNENTLKKEAEAKSRLVSVVLTPIAIKNELKRPNRKLTTKIEKKENISLDMHVEYLDDEIDLLNGDELPETDNFNNSSEITNIRRPNRKHTKKIEKKKKYDLDMKVDNKINSSNNDELPDNDNFRDSNEIANIQWNLINDNEMDFTKYENVVSELTDNNDKQEDGNEDDCKDEITDDDGDDLKSDDDDSDCSVEKTEKKKRKENSDSDPDFIKELSEKIKRSLDGTSENKKRYKYIKYNHKKELVQYKNVAEVMQFYTITEMSEEELTSTLKREKATVNERKRRKCTKCGQSFEFQKPLLAHKRLAHSDSNSGMALAAEFPGVHREPCLWRCKDCNKPLRTQHVLAHRLEYHRYQFRCLSADCEWSQKVFRSSQDAMQHSRELHRRCVCDICGYRTMKKHMVYHIQETHTGLRTARCPHCACARRYTRKGLSAHLERAHAPPGPPELRYCVECDRTYRNRRAYYMHVHQAHRAAPKKWPCTVCGLEWSSKSRLKCHVANHHGGTTDHRCDTCGKYLSNRYNLRCHMMSHSNMKKLRVKNKPCTVCGKMFAENCTLRYHMYTHTGERPYKCSHCDAAFTQPYCLTMHLAKTHGDKSTKVTSYHIPNKTRVIINKE